MVFRVSAGSEVNVYDLWMLNEGYNEMDLSLQTVDASHPGAFKSSLLTTRWHQIANVSWTVLCLVLHLCILQVNSILILCILPPYCLTPGGTLTHISYDHHCVDTCSGALLTQAQHTEQSVTRTP